MAKNDMLFRLILLCVLCAGVLMFLGCPPQDGAGVGEGEGVVVGVAVRQPTKKDSISAVLMMRCSNLW